MELINQFMQGLSEKRFKNLPHEVYLNPYYDSFTARMEDLFLQFISEDDRLNQIKGLLEKAAQNQLQPSDHPAPFQQDSIASFSSLNRSVMNAPPVMRRKQNSFTRTLGPISMSVNETPRKESIMTKPSLISTLRLEDHPQQEKLPSLISLLNEILQVSDDSFNAKEMILSTLLTQAEKESMKASARSISKGTTELNLTTEQLRTMLKDVLELPMFFSTTLAKKLRSINRRVHPRSNDELLQGLAESEE